MTGPSTSANVRRRLVHSWLPFFARFGRLNALQQQVIPLVLDGRNVAVASPTASGKTEAVLAPLAERLYPVRGNGLVVAYLVPTRALANDMLTRIGAPMIEMGFPVVLKHGDRPSLPSQSPAAIITTPESLDSMICRRADVFKSLRAVVLDEIHLFDGTPRGDQIRVLLQRLRAIAVEKPAVHLLSATLSDPAAVATRYVEDYEVVKVTGGRAISYEILSSCDDLHKLAVREKYLKVLCFCNLRETVETTAAELSRLWKPHPVVPHHGSLSRHEREKAESVMKTARVAVCVATSTLEMGIDIGSIDLVALAEPPWTLAALLQRIGRGCRRRQCITAAAIAHSQAEHELLEAMFESAIAGNLPADGYRPDLSVAVQQTFSMLFECPQGVPEECLAERFLPLCSPDVTRRILHFLREKEWIEYRHGRWYASMQVMDWGESGKIHSNIPDTRRRTVIDTTTGRDVGVVAGLADDVFLLGRRAWQVISANDVEIRVRPYAGAAAPPVFHRQGGDGAFSRFLPHDLAVARP